MGARKGIRAEVLDRLRCGMDMTGRQIEALYIECGGAVNERKRVSFDTMRHLLNGLPIKRHPLPDGFKSRMLDRTYSIDRERDAQMEQERNHRSRTKALLQSLLQH